MPEISQYELDDLRRKADETTYPRRLAKWIVTGIGAVLGVIIVLILIWKLVTPQLNLYRANTEKQARIAESKAKAEAAKFESAAEVERARGAAEANAIIADSLTEPYLRYLYILNLDIAGAEVIYVPTEAGLPILEAGRLPATPPTED